MILSLKSALIILTISTLASCAPSRYVQPLEKGEKAVTASLGGPLTQIPGVATVPIPHTNLTFGQGLTENITVFGGWYPTASIFGVWQFEAGGVFGLINKENWGISTTPMLNFTIDKWETNAKLWPNLDVNAYWEKPFKNKENKSWLFYGGFNNWFEFAPDKAFEEPVNQRYLFSPQIGARLKGEKWDYNLEYKLIAPGINNEKFTVTYSSIVGASGANGLYFSIYRRF